MSNTEIQSNILDSIKKGHKWIDNYAYSLKSYVRVISDKKIEFPKNYFMLSHAENIEISHLKWNECPNKGWGNPDKHFGGVEIFYISKQFKTEF